ncbi:tetratricopeptide repeat protein [Neptuniibacter sp. CAU 1671]|uniref:tetratricopeptide repeat protein n=1 Tax=Neptuniibacter sp. CAU 1671 TaxID=3032593 RepID=UPI0023DBB017|nr:tetratricopeptide repeat protein [Neptuniibacter sp. CAU 1671]MDF2181324.1 tetratricopeptide repeat protein [Neptuniibacter sp. CAU 1671]
MLPLILSGCSTVTEISSQAATQSTDPQPTVATPIPAAGEVIYTPGEFNQESLYSLLVAELAGQRRLFPLALQNYLDQAEKTRDPRVAERAAYIAQFLNNSEGVLSASKIWREVDPSNAEPYQLEATVHLHQGRFDQALPLLQTAMQEDSTSILALIRRQSSKLSEPQRIQYIAMLERQVADNRDDPELLTTLALLYSQAGYALKAEITYDQALAIEPDNLDILIQKAELLHDHGETVRSLELVRQAFEKQPDNRQIHLLYVQLLFGNNQYQAAVKQAVDLRNNNPEDSKLAYYLALLMLENRQFDAARIALHDLLTLKPDDSSPHYYLGYIAQQKKETALALEHYLQVTSGNNLLQSRSRAVALLDQPDDKHEVFAILENAREAYPELTTDLYMLQSEWLDAHGMRAEGIEVLNTALKELGDNPDLLYSRAMLIEATDFRQAEKDLRKILKQDPQNAMTLNALGYTLTLHTKRYEEAYDLISAALRLKPDDAAILDSMGWILFLRGAVSESIPYLELAYERHPDPEVAAHLVQAYWYAKQQRKALDLLQTALNKAPDNPHLIKTKALLEQEPTQ